MPRKSDLHSIGPIGYFVLAAISVFGLTASIFSAASMIDIIRSMTFASSIAVVIAFSPPAWEALWDRPASKSSILAVGIWLSWFAVANGSLQIILGYDFGQPWVFRSVWNALTAAATFGGAVCHLLAPQAIGNIIPRRAWVYVGTVAGVGILLIMFLIEAKTFVYMRVM